MQLIDIDRCKRTTLFKNWVINFCLSRDTATSLTWALALYTTVHSPVSAYHSYIFLSCLPETKDFPSGTHGQAVICCVCEKWADERHVKLATADIGHDPETADECPEAARGHVPVTENSAHARVALLHEQIPTGGSGDETGHEGELAALQGEAE